MLPLLHRRDADKATRLARAILMLYGTIYYIIPMLLTATLGQPLDAILAGSPNYTLGSAFILTVLGLTWFTCGKIRAPSFAWLQPFATAIFGRFVILGASVAYLLLAYWYSQELGISFRQTGDRIGSSGGFVIVFLSLQGYIFAALLLTLGMNDELQQQAGWPITTALALIVIGSLLSLSAASGVVLVATSLLLLLRHIRAIDLIGASGIGQTFLALTALGVVFILALFVGIANKVGVEEAMYMFSNELDAVIYRFQYRISWHFFSASFHLTYNFADFSLGVQAVREVLSAISHRLDVLLGNPTYFNEVASVRRLNWEELSLVKRERTGASPGMVASVFFVPGGVFMLPVSIVVYALLLLMIAKAASGRKLSIFGLIFLVVYYSGVADSSIDLLNPLDPAFLKLTFLALACASYSPASRSAGDERVEASRYSTTTTRAAAQLGR
ncbi:hypothetical protein G7A66_10130 [Altererythrobacter sp. SALINAS58]|uniref:hypothetical protein n=1 Tax=Alteripontixanthobacter muriae TaxID=2705546 RepID=UPI0015758028|nr:hypothetical protein [Alteripontixanthobacter muriae]NTZ43430.1 hypothetical protein [Alteripontixanthobacter muriae]